MTEPTKQGKSVYDTKTMPDTPPPEKKPEKVNIRIEPGNIPVLTVQMLDAINQMLDAINKNLMVIIDMISEQINKGKSDG